MPDIHVYLNSELFRKYQVLDNKSSVISMLLEEYFSKQFKPNLSEVKENLEKAKSEVEKFSEIKNKIEIEKHIEDLTEKEKIEKEQKKLQDKWESVRRNASSFFPDFAILEKRKQDELIDEFLFRNSDNLNLVQFFLSKNFKDNISEDGKSNNP